LLYVLYNSLDPGMQVLVKKFGARTGLTHGKVVAMSDGVAQIAPIFTDELVSNSGDSGACWVLSNVPSLENVILGIHLSSAKASTATSRATIRLVWDVADIINKYQKHNRTTVFVQQKSPPQAFTPKSVG